MTSPRMTPTGMSTRRMASDRFTQDGYHSNPKWLGFNLRSICAAGHSLVA